VATNRAIVNTDWLTFLGTRYSAFTHALTSEVDRVGHATALLLQMVTNAILVSVYVLFALRISAVMTITVFTAGLILALLLRRRTRKSRGIGEEISAADGSLYSATIEHLGV
jgi:ATP-binding cassette, subfamily C, bacterial